MNPKVSSTPTHAYLQTNGSCTDHAMIQHRQRYLDKVLSPTESDEFRQHLLGCLPCATSVTNAKMMAAASTDRALDDTALTTCFEQVNIVAPPCPKWRDIAAALMTFRR